jgi:hypothetical protein
LVSGFYRCHGTNNLPNLRAILDVSTLPKLTTSFFDTNFVHTLSNFYKPGALMNKNTIIKILKDFVDYTEHYLLDDDSLDDYAEKIIEELDQPCGISVKDASKELGLNKTVLNRGQRENILGNPLSQSDMIFLERLKKFWSKSWFLRPQIKRFGTKERIRLLDAPELQHNWERRVYYWYLGQPEGIKDERSQFHDFTMLPVKTVMIALYYFYPRLFSQSDTDYMEEWKKTKRLSVFDPFEINGKWARKERTMPVSLNQIKNRIIYIRKMAQRDKSRFKKKGISHDEILELRGIKKTDLSGFMNTERNISYNLATGLPDDYFAPKDKPRY